MTWRQVFLSSKHYGALAVGINASSRHHILSLTSLLLRVSLLSWKHAADTRRRIRFVLLQKQFLLDQRISKIALDALHARCCRVRLLFVSSCRVAHRKWRSIIRIVLHKWYNFLQEAKANSRQRKWSSCFSDWVGGYDSRQSLHRALESWKDYLQAEKACHIQNGRRNMRLSWIQFRVLRCSFRPILDAWKRVHAAQLHKSLKNRLVTKSVKRRYGLIIQKWHLIAWFERAFQDKMYAANLSTRASRTYNIHA